MRSSPVYERRWRRRRMTEEKGDTYSASRATTSHDHI
jgi:hypothetical protein